MDCIHHSETTFPFFRNGEQIFSGTPDSVWVFQKPSAVVVADRKFGFKEVTPADANLQLRTYIVMVADVYPAENYYGIITQPRISSKPVIVQYTATDVVRARAEIERVYDACFATNPPRRPSNDGCDFCMAHAVCPEYKAWLGEIERVKHLPVSQWTDAQMEIFEERRTAALKFIEEVHEEIKRIKAAFPERLPSYALKPGANVRSVTDLVQAWAALQPVLSEGYGKEAARKFSDCCKMAIGDMEDLIYDQLKNDPKKKLSQKDVKRLVNDLLSGVIELRQNKPSLVKEKE